MKRRGVPGRVPAEYEAGDEPQTTRFWNHNPPDDDYEPASSEYNLAQARGVLARMYGVELSTVVKEAPCDDCKEVRALRKYGQMLVCFRCETRRRRAKERAA